MEDQAINRAHRIGATGQVTVTRMLILDTIEERINLVLEEKRERLLVEDPVAEGDGVAQNDHPGPAGLGLLGVLRSALAPAGRRRLGGRFGKTER